MVSPGFRQGKKRRPKWGAPERPDCSLAAGLLCLSFADTLQLGLDGQRVLTAVVIDGHRHDLFLRRVDPPSGKIGVI